MDPGRGLRGGTRGRRCSTRYSRCAVDSSRSIHSLGRTSPKGVSPHKVYLAQISPRPPCGQASGSISVFASVQLREGNWPANPTHDMIILGLNAYHGDSSACLLEDGRLIAAAEEERFRRIKH